MDPFQHKSKLCCVSAYRAQRNMEGSRRARFVSLSLVLCSSPPHHHSILLLLPYDTSTRSHDPWIIYDHTISAQMKARVVHCGSDSLGLDMKKAFRRQRMRRRKTVCTGTMQRPVISAVLWVYIGFFGVYVCFIPTTSWSKDDSTHQCQLKVTASGT